MDNERTPSLVEDQRLPPRQGRKRSHQTMVDDDARIDTFFTQTPQYPPSDPLQRYFPLPQREGYRRPDNPEVRSTIMDNVIDLTGAESPPRDSQPASQGSRPRPVIIDLVDDDEIVHMGTNSLQPTPAEPAHGGISYFARQAQDRMQDGHGWVDQFSNAIDFAHRMRTITRLSNMVGNPFNFPGRRRIQPTVLHGRRETSRQPAAAPFQVPEMHYEQVAFNLGPRQQPERYAPAPPAKEGFKRTLEEGDVPVCPNCDDELYTGDNDTKKQVWVIKSCGHVYCGQCATNRHKNGQKSKSNESTKTFKRCVVDGCTNTTTSSSKAMVQIYI